MRWIYAGNDRLSNRTIPVNSATTASEIPTILVKFQQRYVMSHRKARTAERDRNAT
jgi:hypothetical protein